MAQLRTWIVAPAGTPTTSAASVLAAVNAKSAPVTRRKIHRSQKAAASITQGLAREDVKGTASGDEGNPEGPTELPATFGPTRHATSEPAIAPTAETMPSNANQLAETNQRTAEIQPAQPRTAPSRGQDAHDRNHFRRRS